MNHQIQVSNAQSGEAIVSAVASTEANAEAAANALKTAFPDACVHYQVAKDGKQGRGMYVTLSLVQQSLDDFTAPPNIDSQHKRRNTAVIADEM